jgi:hypothetical protein
MRGVANFMSEYGLWLVGIVVLIAIGGLVIRFFHNEKKSETFQYLVILVLGLVVVPQVWVWVSDVSVSGGVCPNVTSVETRSCLLTTAWSNWVKVERAEDSGMRLCQTHGALSERKDYDGTTYWRYRSPDGKFLMQYRLFPTQTDCANIDL